MKVQLLLNVLFFMIILPTQINNANANKNIYANQCKICVNLDETNLVKENFGGEVFQTNYLKNINDEFHENISGEETFHATRIVIPFNFTTAELEPNYTPQNLQNLRKTESNKLKSKCENFFAIWKGVGCRIQDGISWGTEAELDALELDALELDALEDAE